MEIARLEVSTQNHLDRMQETAKINYIQYGKSTNIRRVRGLNILHLLLVVTGAVEAMENSLNQVEKAGKFHYPWEPVTDVAKGDIKKTQNARLWKLSVKVVTKRGALRRSV